MAIALVETTASSINYSKYFKFEFDRYARANKEEIRKANNRLNLRIKKLKEKHD